MSRLTELLQAENIDSSNPFEAWFTGVVEKGVEQIRKSSVGQEFKRRALQQEINELLQNPVLLLVVIAFFIIVIWRR